MVRFLARSSSAAAASAEDQVRFVGADVLGGGGDLADENPREAPGSVFNRR
jgi:hypothetical protein